MKIDGRLIATEIKEILYHQIVSLKQKNIIPHLAVVLIGDDPSSVSYVRQKQKVGEELGAKVTLSNMPEDTPGVARRDSPGVEESKQKLVQLVHSLNCDPTTHGIIIQRPVPLDISSSQLDQLVIPEKDIDGFHPHSPFTPPIAMAVIKILDWIYREGKKESPFEPKVKESPLKGDSFIGQRSILIIGRGDTGGKPIADYLSKLNIPFRVAHSKTPEEELKMLCLDSDIIISCVGKYHIVRQSMVNKKTILIGVGLHSSALHPKGDLASHLTGKKLEPDYNQEEMANRVAFYTPVPGGVGPVNVACLFENLLHATTLQT